MQLYVGDTLSKVRLRFRDDGNPIDLTGASIVLEFRIGEGAKKSTLPITVVGDPKEGLAEYQWSVGDVDVAGRMVVLPVINSAGRNGPTKEFEILVKSGI
jgi:BppU N-terminal domain